MTIATPPLYDVILDPETVAQLFFDVGHAAELLGITLKTAGARRSVHAATCSLDEAYRALVAGTGVQLRYRFGNEEWWDTLLHAPTGIRLIRVSHTVALAIDSNPT